jgi:mevalonate kinase
VLQFDFFSEMIPEKFKRIWENGIQSGTYSLKLCGSGGGGFILGFSWDFKKTEEFINKNEVQALHL